MTTPESDRIEGPVRLTLKLDELEAIKNPELFGPADWMLRLLINDNIAWVTDRPISVGAGRSAPIGAEIHHAVTAEEDYVELRVEASEKDLLPHDDPAASQTERLYRTVGFGRATGLVIDVVGRGAHIKLHMSVDVVSAA
jgi:hypothetical protein